jgi:serine/threonine protein kinase
MPAPETTQQFLDLVRKSEIVDEGRLRNWLDVWCRRPEVFANLGKVAGLLFQDGLVTFFQADQLLQGKWRRFHIGGYTVLERLGSGMQGTVYLCRGATRGLVAIKVLPARYALNPAGTEQFYDEARRLAKLYHPCFVRALEVNQDELLHFLVMDFVDGSTLKVMVAGCEWWETYNVPPIGQTIPKKCGPMEVARASHYIGQAAEGLQHLHEVGGFAHGDIEPGNLMLDRSGRIRIIDLGGPVQGLGYGGLSSAYAAPEQVGHVDIRTDIYSLGAVFYFLLAGHPPFRGTAEARRAPRRIREIVPTMPDGLATVLDKMLAENPEDRYQTPLELMAELAPWAQVAPPPPRAEEMPCHCLAVREFLA